MAQPPLSSASGTDSQLPSSSTPALFRENPVLLSLPIATKLTRSNYLSWQSQIISVLHGYDLYNYINPQIPAPQPTFLHSTGQLELNPTYVTWHKQDQILLGWLRASLSEVVLAQVVSCSSSSQLWLALQRSFSSVSRARLTELRRNLQNLTKGGSSCSDYLLKIQSIADELAFIGHPVSDGDQVTQILNGLGSDFNSFVVAVTARAEPINLYDLHSLLLSHEQLIQTQHLPSDASLNSSAFYAHHPGKKTTHSHYNGFQSRSNGSGSAQPQTRSRPTNAHTVRHSNRPNPQFGPSASTGPGILPLPQLNLKQGNFSNPYKNEICQVCSKRGHIAINCWHRFDSSYGDIGGSSSQ